MGLFDNFFGNKNKKTENINNDKSELELLMVDWFSASGLSYDEYKKEFYPALFELMSNTEYIEKKLDEKEKENVDLSIAFIYLIYHYTDFQFIERVFEIFYPEGNYYSGKNYINFNISNAEKEKKKLKNILDTVSFIWKIRWRIKLNKSPFDEIYKFTELKYTNNKEFKKVFNYVDNRYQGDKLIPYVKIYLINKFDYKTSKSIEPDEEVKSLILKNLTREIKKYNQNTYFHLDLDILEDFDKLYIRKQGFKKHNETPWQERGSVKLNEHTDLMIFLDKNNPKTILNHYIFSFKYNSNTDSFNKELILILKNKIDFDNDYFEKILQIQDHLHPTIMEHLVIPLVNELEISYDSNLRRRLEYILHKSHYPKRPRLSEIFKRTTDKITDEIKREVVKMKYGIGGSAVLRISGGTEFLPGAKNASFKRDLKKITKIVNLSVLSVKINYDEYYNSIAKVIYNGVEKEIDYPEINSILLEEKTGYQLVPIPITIYDDFYDYSIEKYGKMYFCRLAFLNQRQFNYLTKEYLPKYFPDINMEYSYLKNYQFNVNNPLSFDEYIKTKKTRNEEKNRFLVDNNWKWFKEKYIDELSNFKQWYKVMEVIISFSGSKKVSKKWSEKITKIIEKQNKNRYLKELNSLLEKSINEEFWYYDDNRNALKALAWTCNLSNDEDALLILKKIITASYKKIPGKGPRSAAIGNFALDVLINHPNPDSFGILNLLYNQTKYVRFQNILDKYINKYIETSDEDPEVLADRSIPDYGFKNGEKIIDYKYFSVVFKIKNKKVSKRWILNSKETATLPKGIKEKYPKLVKEVSSEVKTINSFIKATKSRIKTYWINNRKWKYKEWEQNIFKKEMLSPWLQGLVWYNETKNNTFILIENTFYNYNNEKISNNDEDIISLWHPITSNDTEIKNWQLFIINNKIEQSERQVFREYYPFTENEIKMDSTPRFNHHFLKLNKLMALANSVGWTFTYVHNDVNWPRTYIKYLDITVHLQCDHHTYDVAIPIKDFFITKEDTRKINYNQNFKKIAFNKIPATTLSEFCRNVDLFISTCSIALDVELSKQSEILSHYRNDFTTGDFSDNAQAMVRKQIIELIGYKIGIKEFSFDKNKLIVVGKWNKYSINLGSGFVQIKNSKRHVPIIPNIDIIKKKTKNILPVKDDETLYIILSEALFLQDETQIKDEKIINLLKK